MIKGFTDFILRGNVVDLAVAVVVGTAFGAIVTALTAGIIQPLINAVTPSSSRGLGVQLVAGKDSTYIDLAAVVTATLNFLVAAVVYFVIVLPLSTLKERSRRGEEAGPSAAPTDVELLTEIRDLHRSTGRPGATG